MPASIHIIGGPRRKRGTERGRKFIWKNNDWKFPYPGEENRYPGQDTKSPKEDEPEEIHAKTYYT